MGNENKNASRPGKERGILGLLAELRELSPFDIIILVFTLLSRLNARDKPIGGYMEIQNRLQPLPLQEEERTLVSLRSMQSHRWFGSILIRWKAITGRGNTLLFYFYGSCLDVVYIERWTRKSRVYRFDGIKHALPQAEVLRLLGLCMVSKQEVTA